jgi:hypothetical protein
MVRRFIGRCFPKASPDENRAAAALPSLFTEERSWINFLLEELILISPHLGSRGGFALNSKSKRFTLNCPPFRSIRPCGGFHDLFC